MEFNTFVDQSEIKAFGGDACLFDHYRIHPGEWLLTTRKPTSLRYAILNNMEAPEEALRRSDLLDTTPETDTYAILGFLCAHRESTVTPTAIADQTGCPESTVVTVLDRLEAIGAVDQLADGVQIDTNAAETIARRLKSLDQVTRLFDAAPDDAYANVDWESQVGTIDYGDEDER